jgi:hypothetical protein
LNPNHKRDRRLADDENPTYQFARARTSLLGVPNARAKERENQARGAAEEGEGYFA